MASPTPSDDNVSKRDVDAGFAWIIVLVVMLNFFNLSLHFAAFSVLYLEYVETFDMTVGQIGIAMSVNSCFTNLAGLVIPSLFSHIDQRVLCVTSALISSLAFMLSGLVQSYTALLIAYGISGTGNGVQYVINSAILQQYFDKKRPLATGLTTMGMSVCMTVVPPLTRLLTDLFAWQGAVILLAGLLLQSVWLSVLLRPQTSQTSSSKEANSLLHKDESTKRGLCAVLSQKFNLRLLLNVKFLMFGVATVLFFTGYNMFYLHMVNRALASGLTKHQASLVPTPSGIVNLIWRPTFGLISTVFHFQSILIVGLATLMLGVIMALFGTVDNFYVFMLFSALAGVFVASQVISYHPALVDILGVENILGGVSLLGIFLGAGQTIGTPLAGWIYDVTNDYSVPFYVAGVIELMAGACYLTLFLVHSRTKTTEETVVYELDEKLKAKLKLESDSVISSTLSVAGIGSL